MRSHKIPDAHNEHPNVTPLIDIVMCLIIFYMLVARIGINTGKQKEITLPVALQGVKLTDMGNTVTLNVSANGDEPMVTTLGKDGQLVDIKVIDATRGARPLKDYLTGLRGQNAEFKVIIRADENLDYRHLEPVLLSCAEAKAKNVNFAARTAPTAPKG